MSSEHPSPPQPLPSQTWWGSQRNSPFLGLIIHHTDQNYSYVLNESHFHFSVNFKKVGIELVVLFTESESHSVVSNSLWPHGLYSPWNSPGQNTGVDSLFLLQGILPTQGLNPGLPHCRQILYLLSHQGKSKNTGVGSVSLLQGIFLTQESNWGLLLCRRNIREVLCVYPLPFTQLCSLRRKIQTTWPGSITFYLLPDWVSYPIRPNPVSSLQTYWNFWNTNRIHIFFPY